MQKPKAEFGTFSDASCITHGVNFTGGGVRVSEPWDVQYIHGQDDRCFLALALQLSGLAPAKTDANQVWPSYEALAPVFKCSARSKPAARCSSLASTI
jgi:hypothetical protein